MIHRLALATNPQLLEKVAITVEQHQAGRSRDIQKAIDLAVARGQEIPLVPKAVGWDPVKKEVIEEMVPDVANMRMSGKPATPPTGAAKVAPGLIEKEIQQAHSGLTPVKKLRHQTVGKAKRLWGGAGGLGGKWRNRLALLGGLGAIGLGAKSYLDQNRMDQPQLQPQQNYNKMGAFTYVQDAANIPKPPSQPKVPSPGPGVKGVGQMGPQAPAGVLGAPKGDTGAGGSDKESAAAPGVLKQADETLLPVLAGGLGGVAGWGLGEKVVKPMIESRERTLAEAIAKHQRDLARLKGAKQMVPIGAAAAGALLLAALAASKARQDERMQASYPPQAITSYDPSGAGFVPNNMVYPGQFY